MNSMLFLSIFALVLSIILLLNKIQSYLLRLSLTTLIVFSFFLIASYHISDILTNNGFDESVLFHIKMGLSGSSLSDFWQVIVYGSLLFLIMVLMANYTYKRLHTEVPKKNHFIIITIAIALLFYSIFSNPIIDNIRTFFVYNSDQTFYDHYRIPTIGTHDKRSKKNIVYIYAESLERTYFDETLFPGLIEGLRKIEKKSISFNNIFQVYATGWTIAGMTASQCGIPLITPTGGNAMSGFKENFLPLAKCMGDLLHDEGYELEYYGGSSLEFAGKGNFYKSHSFSKVQGKEELKGSLDDPLYLTGWGLYDDSLLQIVYAEYERLSRNNKPFGLFTLTLDTHHPIGNASKRCKENNIVYEDGSNSMLNTIKCSDYLIAEFINKILASPYAKDTVIVLSSDHLAMPNIAYETLEKGNRRNLFMVIDGSQKINTGKIFSKGSMLDITPTLMGILGYSSSQMGLGRNLLLESSLINIDNRADTLKKEKSYKVLPKKNQDALNIISINGMLASWRDYFLTFWKYPTFANGIKVDTKKQNVIMEKLIVRYPVVMMIDKNKKVIPKFNFNSRGRMQDRIVVRDIENLFIWIDYCNYMKKPVNIQGKEGTSDICFAFVNRESDFIYVSQIDENTSISNTTITALINHDVEYLKDIKFIQSRLSDVVDNLDVNRTFSERCHSGNFQPKDIIEKHSSEDTIILMSAYHLDINSTSDGFFDFLSNENSVLPKLRFNDLYLGVIKNKEILIEKVSDKKPVKYGYDFNGTIVSVETSGLDSLFKSSIIVNGFELSANYAGINIVIVNLKTGDTDTYNFPSYPKP